MATVRAFTALGWSAVGSPRFSRGPAFGISLALHPSTGTPFVAYRDLAYKGVSGEAVLMTFKASAGGWSAVGPTESGFSPGSAEHTSLALHPKTGDPYVAFKDGSIGGKATVMYSNANGWNTLGAAGISAFAISGISLALHPSTGAPYVAFTDTYSINSGRATVMTYAGAAWSTVGSPRFSSGSVYLGNLALHPTTGAPYVAYMDMEDDGRATLVTYG